MKFSVMLLQSAINPFSRHHGCDKYAGMKVEVYERYIPKNHNFFILYTTIYQKNHDETGNQGEDNR